ncbi:hypothetical protein SNOG_02879 [Parastagonospora nodorum SN15]|uniref:Uncharacterized protein n=1 Tax=Phaeosphaeria nodorum (strain SN15 / ATCC MYA-4574 / FGSC 10173) TaxID=321614 RepID=Q0UZD5_PHANO|nr:hypothetical protein SNOG_02879 [Parastagonospora nodorum SN15]EAT89610.1 hypothetical protein SNOG_02879 [Parastagonospora nodorum SN15]
MEYSLYFLTDDEQTLQAVSVTRITTNDHLIHALACREWKRQVNKYIEQKQKPENGE